jgi:hypothetical protein
MTNSVSVSSATELGEIAGQIASVVSATGVPQVANAVYAVATDIGDIQNPTLVQRINQLTQDSQKDVTNFKDLLIAGDFVGVDRMFASVPEYLGIDISDAEFQQLRTYNRAVDLFSILASYAGKRQGKLEADIRDLIQSMK